jgi:hypothetical protein|tara:strand:+ start:870 stop:1058 length:189 start_codon:yes stop_codon:yes gene_type:complete
MCSFGSRKLANSSINMAMNAIDAVIKAFSYKADKNSNKWNKECNLSPILTIFIREFFINNKI